MRRRRLGGVALTIVGVALVAAVTAAPAVLFKGHSDGTFPFHRSAAVASIVSGEPWPH